MSLENSPNSRVEFGDFSKLKGWVWRFLQTQVQNLQTHFFRKKNEIKKIHTLRGWVWRILQTQGLSLEISPNSRVEFGDFSKLRFKISKLIFFGKKRKLKKTHTLRGWVWRILQTQGLSLEISPNSRVEFGDFSKLRFKISKLIFFGKKNEKKKKNTHTQRLSLENSPNSRVEFGDFPELRLKQQNPESMFFFQKPKWVWRILQTQVLSLENSANSDSKDFFSEFGEFSKLKGWVWRFLQTQVQNLQTHFSWKKTKFKKYTHSEVEFGEFSKLKCWVGRIIQTHIQKERFLWLWRNLQTQGLSLENSSNSGSKSPNSFFSKKKTKYKQYTHSEVEFGDCLQTQVENLQTHFLRKKKRNLKKHTHSEVEFGEFSKLKGWVWRFPRTQIQKKQNLKTCLFFKNQNEFGEFSKFKCWVWRILQTQIQKSFFWVWRIFQTQELSLENSPNSRVELSLEIFSKLKGWVWRFSPNSESKEKISDFFLKMHLENSQKVH